MKRKAILLMSLLLISMGAGPCDVLEDMMGSDAGTASCGEALCENRLEIEFIRADDDWFQPGSYRFDVLTPDGSEYFLECYYSLEGTAMACEYGNLESLGASVSQDGTVVWLVAIGAPESLQVSMEYNGYALAEKVLYPDYEEDAPNGEGCEPICYHGEETLAVMPW